ncbi:MAG: IclR family transcriptional regulator [Deltaproteobacteria bacterium]|nr:MAG: IclR family transcriptional regulator [Deltaproteobacteria bacterium]
MAKREKSSYVIKSVANALDLLEEFSGDVRELGVTELSRRLRLHKNNVFRLLATLEQRGYIEQNKETENYRLGLKSLELGQTFLRQIGLVRQTRPILEELVKKCNENANLGVIRQNSVVVLDVVETEQSVRVASRIGWRLPVYCSAMGKAQIAFKSESEIERIISWDEMKKFTENTITGREKFHQHLKEIREKGYAVDNEEYEPGVKCVGVPIWDYTKNVVAGISVSGPAFRLINEILEKEIIPRVIEAGREISKRLGYET